MQRFKNILVVVERRTQQKDLAIIKAIELAKKNSAKLMLMDIIPPPQGLINEYKGIIKAQEITEMLVNDREKELRSVVEVLNCDVNISVKVSIGNFIEILKQVFLGKHDILIKSANEHPFGFDSVDFHLMRKCPSPVWLLKPLRHKKQPLNILAAIDISLEKNHHGKVLNRLIMDLSTSLSTGGNANLYICSCWSLYGENALRYSGFLKIPEGKVDELLREEEQTNRECLNALVRCYETRNIETHLIKGAAVDCIPVFVKKHNIGVVVMGTLARSGIPGLLIGNTAETILQRIDTSVIALKPPGFKSLVE